MLDNNTISLLNLDFYISTAFTYGGAILAQNKNNLTITSCYFRFNVIVINGGSIFM